MTTNHGTRGIAAIVATILVYWSLLHGGPALVAVVIVAIGLAGAAVFLPLARALAHRGDSATGPSAAASRPQRQLPAVAVHAEPNASRAVCQCLDLRSSPAAPRGYETSTPSASLGHRLTSP